MVTATDGADAAGFSYLRIPLGASDFSATGTNVFSLLSLSAKL